ncbi:uncharacterized protein [Mycetomoellerius zeteki]|uniref:uncharacterized protein n=1 Tax=Mycetomoellerius zeteki TaxID=64791 RepID=UPI00084E9120|nr:PREDICTED: uncharacterized protein LOC108722494 [Trachymyrmex zeteki]
MAAHMCKTFVPKKAAISPNRSKYLRSSLLEYSITDTHEVHSRLQSDAGFLSQYLDDNTTAPILNSIVDDTTNNTNTGSEIKNFSWTQRSTKLLLNSYLERKDRFRDPKVKKKVLWTEILLIMKENGYSDLNEDLLDRKMRNMKKSYKNIKDNNNKKTSTGRGRISWEYFDTFEDIFANDMTINYSSTLSSMQGNNEITANESSQDDNELIDQSPLSCPSTRSSSASPCASVTQISEPLRKARMSTLHKLRQKQISIEEKRLDTMLQLKSSIDRSNQIQEERNKLIEQFLLLRSNQHDEGKKNT